MLPNRRIFRAEKPDLAHVCCVWRQIGHHGHKAEGEFSSNKSFKRPKTGGAHA
jgi:hypothetical protein